MRIENYSNPKSSFLSLEKDSSIIFREMMKNQRLLKYLYYPVPEALQMPDLTTQQILGMLNNEIKIVPKIQVDDKLKTNLIISFDNFIENYTNPEFRDNTISFDVLCNYDCWNLGDFKLRPFKIAGEIDSMFCNKHLTGIGVLEFLKAKELLIDAEFGGISLIYKAIHGSDDRVSY